MNGEAPLSFSAEGSFSTTRSNDGLVSSESSENNPVRASTLHLMQTYKKCNPEFEECKKLPARVLTQPAEPSATNSHDNKEGNLIGRVNDTIQSEKDTYSILDILGTGTFGQVFKCQIKSSGQIVAVKVVKGKPAYRNQGLLEVKIAKLLNSVGDPEDTKHIVRILDSFEYLGHICIVFELLGSSLLDILTHNQFRGVSLATVQRYTKQLLSALIVLQESSIIHCDLKPENILLCNMKSSQGSEKAKSLSAKQGLSSGGNGMADEPAAESESMGEDESSRSKTESQPSDSSIGGTTYMDIKVIDFGSACYEGRTMYSYIQSRFYRSPEVLVGVPYNGAIDMWSLGCVCAEMFLGLPLFPGVSQHNQLTRIVDMLGPIPDFLVSQGKNGGKFFKQSRAQETSSVWDSKTQSSSNKSNRTYRLKTAEEFAFENNTSVPTFRKYLRYDKLDEIILKCPLPRKSKLTPQQKTEEVNRRKCFLDFLSGLFRLNPWERWTAKQAFAHPFIRDFTRAGTGPVAPMTLAAVDGVVSGGGSGERGLPHSVPFIPPPDPIVEQRLTQYQSKLFGDDPKASASSKVSSSTSGGDGDGGKKATGSTFTLLKKSDRSESEPVVLPTQAQPAMERGTESSGKDSDGKSLWSGWSLWGIPNQQQQQGGEGSPSTQKQSGEPQPSGLRQQQQQYQQQQPHGQRGSMGEGHGPSMRRKSNPYGYSHSSRQPVLSQSQMYGSPPDTRLPPNYTQWQQQQQSYGAPPRSMTDAYQDRQQQPQTAYSFSGSMMNSLFQSPHRMQQQPNATTGNSDSSAGAVPIPMPSSGHSGVVGNGQNTSSPFGSYSSSYGIASSMGGVGSMSGMTGTDFGRALNRPELDENKYLQSFGFQQRPNLPGGGGSSLGSPAQRGVGGSAQKPPLSASYSADYGGATGFLVGSMSPHGAGSYMDMHRNPAQSHMPSHRHGQPTSGTSPYGHSYMQQGLGGVGHSQGIAQHGDASLQSTTGVEVQTAAAPPGRDLSLSQLGHSLSNMSGLPRHADERDKGELILGYNTGYVNSDHDLSSAEKGEGSKTIATGGGGKPGDTDGEDDMFFESDDLLAGDV